MRNRLANPLSKSPAMANPVKAPPIATACKSAHTNWKAVYPAANSNPGTSPTRDNPPAKAAKKKIGNAAGARNVMFPKNRRSCLPATANATEKRAFIGRSVPGFAAFGFAAFGSAPERLPTPGER